MKKFYKITFVTTDRKEIKKRLFEFPKENVIQDYRVYEKGKLIEWIPLTSLLTKKEGL